MIKEYSPKQLSILNDFDKIVKSLGKYPTVDELSQIKLFGKIRYNFGSYSNLIDEYTLWKQPEVEDVEEDAEFLKQVYKYKELLKIERKRKDLLLKQVASQENIYDYICQNMPVIEYKHIQKIKSLNSNDKKDGTAILHLSDLHYGEVVQMGDIVYDCAIAESNLSSIVSKFCNIAKSYNKTVIVCNGDLLNGVIHEIEFGRTNEMVMTDSVIRLSKLLVESFLMIYEYMRDDNKSMKIIFTVGNHSRIIPGGVYYKNKVKENWEYLLGLIIKRELSYIDNNIDVEVCNTPSSIIEIEGLRFAITHGDNFKSLNNIRMNIAKFQEMCMSTIGKFDHMLIGHFHQFQIMPVLGGLLFVNGAFKPYDEYSIANGYSINHPSQTCICVEDKEITNILPLYA